MAEKDQEILLLFLDKNNIKYSLSQHKPVFTSEESATIRNTSLGSGVKAILFKSDDDFFLVLIRADKKINVDKLSTIIGSNNVRMARTKELLKITGCKPGSVHPFGNLWKIQVFMDNHFDVSSINFNAGMHTTSVSMNIEDLIKLVDPKMVDVAI